MNTTLRITLIGLLLLSACPPPGPATTCNADGDCTKPAVCCSGKCVDVTKDVNHCGKCDSACSTNHASAKCSFSQCSATCASGYGDCNRDVKDGCETDITTDLAHCGKCRQVCEADNASTQCERSFCAMGPCKTGFGDCDKLEGNGCEVDTTKTLIHCGACGKKCEVSEGSGACVDSKCTVAACNMDYGDCDKDPATGCETDLRVTAAHCSACGMACPPSHKCKAGKCQAPDLLFYGGLLNITSALTTNQVSSFNFETRSWTNVATMGTETPGNRSGHLAIWDSVGQRMLVWGGAVNGSTPADTDVYALDFTAATPTWSKATDGGTGGPSARSYMGTAWDKARRVLYVYGGSDTNMNQIYDELWELDVATMTWTKRTESNTPGGRAVLSMVWDAPRSRIVLGLGVDNSGGPASSFYAFDPTDGGTGWSYLTTTNGPTARGGAPFLGDAQPLMLYGGIDDFGLFSIDTFVVDGSDAGLGFTELSLNETPGERAYFSTASANNRRFLYGGFGFDQLTGALFNFNDVWELDLASDAGWSRIADGGINFVHPGTVFMSSVARE